MKNKFYLRYRIPGVLLFTFLFSTTLKAQQSLITVNGWNAYVHLPWDYSLNPSKTYPTIIFFPGIDEIGSSASLLIRNGPGAYISQGWNGNVKVGTDSVKFIVISLQPLSAYPKENTMNTYIQALKAMYRIDNDRLHLTGLSMGGWCSTTFVTGDPAAGPYTYASQIASVVEVEGMKPADNSPYPNLFDNFAKSNGRLLSFEQLYDGRDALTRVNRMNSTKAGSAIYIQTNYSGGGHCCWEQFYGGSGVAPNRFTLDGISQNIYEWIARNPLPVSRPANQAPVARAGTDKLIALPVNSITLSGSGIDADGAIAAYAWAKVAGPSSGTITSPKAASTGITGLAKGVYKFQLTVTDNSGAVGKDTVQITVNAAANKAPVARAGNDITIRLPANTTTLYGSGTDADGTISGYTWAKISGYAGTIVSPQTGTSRITGLMQGIYKYTLTVTDNNGLTGKDTVSVTVNSANGLLLGAVSGSDAVIYGSTDSASGKNLLLNSQEIIIDHLSLYSNRLRFNLTSSKQQKINISVTDVKGSSFLRAQVPVQKGVNTINRSINGLYTGIFYVKLFTNKEMVVKPVVNGN